VFITVSTKTRFLDDIMLKLLLTTVAVFRTQINVGGSDGTFQ